MEILFAKIATNLMLEWKYYSRANLHINNNFFEVYQTFFSHNGTGG